MFELTEADLSGLILGCSDGPASFNAIGTQAGCRIVSVDPLYQFSRYEIAERIDQTAASVAEQLRRNPDEFVWSHFDSVEALIDVRMNAMRVFLEDYKERDCRYVNAASLNYRSVTSSSS